MYRIHLSIEAGFQEDDGLSEGTLAAGQWVLHEYFRCVVMLTFSTPLPSRTANPRLGSRVVPHPRLLGFYLLAMIEEKQ